MKIIKIKTLNETIEELGDKNYGVMGHTLADALRDEKENKKKVADMMVEAGKDAPVEERDAHTKGVKTPELKKMHLAESLFEDWNENDEELNESWNEDLVHDVYNALTDIAFDYHQNKNVILTVKDFEPAWEWFATHFEDNDNFGSEEKLNESINSNTSHAQDFISALRSAGFGDGFDQKLKIDTYGNGGTRIEFKDQGGTFTVTITDDKVVLEGQDEGEEPFKKEYTEWSKFVTEFNDLYPGIPVGEDLEDCQRYPVEGTKQVDLTLNEGNNENEEELTEASYTRSDNKKMLVKPNRDPLVDVIQLTLTDGEWGYVKSPDGTITPSLLPHLSYDIHDVGVSFDKEGRYFVRVWDVSEEALQKVAEVAKQFNREYKIGLDKFAAGDKKWYCLIYLNEDTDFDDPYVDPEAEVNKEGIKGRGTKLRGNPEARHARDNEDLEDSQRYPIESPAPAQTGLREDYESTIRNIKTIFKYKDWSNIDPSTDTKPHNEAKSQIVSELKKMGRSDAADLLANIDIYLTGDPNVIGYYIPEQSKMVLNKELDIKSVVEVVLHELSNAMNESLNEDISVNGSLMEDKISTDMIHDFKPEAGAAEETFNRILEADKMETFEFMLEDRFPNGVTTEELNEILSEESQWIYDQLGMKEYIIPDEDEE